MPLQGRNYRSDVGALVVSRAVAFAVSLPAFILGTATFMLGFSLWRGAILLVGCMLYGAASGGVAWRLSTRRLAPRGARDAWLLVLAMLAVGLGTYFNLGAVLRWGGAPVQAEVAAAPAGAAAGALAWLAAAACYGWLRRARGGRA